MANRCGPDSQACEPGPLPVGSYLAQIVDSEMRSNRAGTGRYLQLVFEVIDGPYCGRRLWSRLNLEHVNRVAVQMARAELTSICNAIGEVAPNDSSDLHRRPLLVQVKCVKRRDTGEIGNEIRGYQPRRFYVPASTNPWEDE